MKVYMEHISTLGIYGDLSESNELTYGICLANHVNKKFRQSDLAQRTK